MASRKVCVIGAGSSGIVAAKVLKERGIAFDCFELGSGVGGNWRFRNDNGLSAAYRSLHINTSKERMAYSDYPMPEDYPDYPHHSQILEYFEDYVDHFEIRSDISFRTAVRSVVADGEGGWRVTVEPAEGGEVRTETYRAVLVASGHHWDPRWPDFPGDFEGRVRHSHEYETPEGLEGKNVLVVGIGNSGVDIACESSRVAANTFLSTRRSAHILPKYAFGKPIDTFTTPFGSRLPVSWQTRGLELILRLARGPQEKFGVPVPEHGLEQAHPTISADLLNLVGHGRIRMKPNLERLCGKTVRFADGSEEAVDEIVYATGYKITFPFFDASLLDPEENRIELYRNVVPPDPALGGLYFIGLIQPLGAIMPLAEAQSEWVAEILAGACTLPDEATMRRLWQEDWETLQRRYVLSPRHTIQVDFYPYLEQLRREIQDGRKRLARSGAPTSAAVGEEAATAS
jgi:cation diffusion facilitator CzcD-associated flavoprotein CzcO